MTDKQIKVLLDKVYQNCTDDLTIHTPFTVCNDMLKSVKNLNSDILVISNLEFLIEIKKIKGNLDNVWYSTNCSVKSLVAEKLGMNINNIKKFIYNTKVSVEGIENMKFDVIVMNPPYGKGNPELKFLSLAEQLRKEDGEVISIQPLRWIQDPLWTLKKNSAANKYKDVFEGKLEVIREIISNNGNNGFDARFNMNLAIFRISNKTDFKYDSYIDNNMINIINRIKQKSKVVEDVLNKQECDGIRVNLQFITAFTTGSQQYKNRSIWFDGKDENGNWWCSKTYIKNQYFKKDGTPFPFSIKFNTVNEAENFIDYVKNGKIFDAITKWYKADVNIRFTEIPFMDDYTRKWSFEDVCNYFEFTKEEIEVLNYYINKEENVF